MNIYEICNQIAFPAIEAFCILLSYMILMNKQNFLKESKIKVYIFILFYVTFTYWISTYLPGGLHTTIVTGFIIITLSIVTSSTLLKSAIVALLVIIYLMITEGLSFLITSVLLHIEVSDLLNYEDTRFYFSLAVKTFQIMIILFILKKKIRVFSGLGDDDQGSGISYILLAIFLVGMVVFNIHYATSSTASIILYEALIILIFLIFIGIGVLVYKEKEELWKIQQQYKLQAEYVKNIETLLNIIRREKHDFSNHINTVYALCLINSENTVEKIKKYLDKLVHNIKSSYRYYNTGNDYVDGLLTVKSNTAFSHDIHLDVDFEEPLNRISLNEYDLISIIGNIVDNAFDAVLSIPDNEQKIVSICTYIEEDDYYLSIANNGPPIPPENIDKIFENGFSTKGRDKEEHGLGLFIIKELVNKHHGEIIVNSSDLETEFLIKLPLSKVKVEKDSSGNLQYNMAH
ncbi:Histidine kinase-, DNA gyrase B-, and HSP90-like ATPase [Geosporobacter subterraneus DSM 17957]|uniref:histidine kinase n=1 Tax=Geosporobacter subterraneus DSM 17957 TaxID=1121919 RepID=A0A1M6P3Z3_9FIRM|nr:ATP-binding protein [Geosporobacter subterraneus]SHK02644.1 Histidine kinase-, DNA gyrase B-, and HSP90-like ATPase [Geosporobacter subterraneus DSM 17957]